MSNTKADINLQIEIKPIPDRGNIRDFSEKLEYFSQSKVISPLVDPVTRKYVTGLSEDDIAYLKSKKFAYDFENDDYMEGIAHPFWENPIIKVELKNTPTFLFPNKSTIDFIKYKYLLKHKYIYASENELKSGVKSQATHFIYDEGVSVSMKANVVQKRNSLIRKISDLSTQRQKDIILILLNEITENKDADYLTVRFDDILNDKSLSLQLELLLENSAEEITLTAEIKSAIQKNVLRRTKQGIFYFENNLGFAEKDVKEFLSKPENQELLLTIKSKIQ